MGEGVRREYRCGLRDPVFVVGNTRKGNPVDFGGRGIVKAHNLLNSYLVEEGKS